MRTISTLETRRTVIDAVSSPRSSFCFRGFTRLDYCITRSMARIAFAMLISLWLGVAAANNDDGFIWVDANTKIRIKPVGSAAGGATKAPEPKKEETKEAPKK